MNTFWNERQNHVSKTELRSVKAASRDSIPEKQRNKLSAEVCDHAADLLKKASAGSMLVYVPFRSELDTWPLIRWAWNNGVTVVVPRSLKHDRSMELYNLRSAEELERGSYGIMEPHPMKAELWDEAAVPDVIWVPGLAFDRKGGRLGYGGGYYDRLRERLNLQESARGKRSLWIGLSYEIQLMDIVPMESHDLRLDGLITENGCIKFEE